MTYFIGLETYFKDKNYKLTKQKYARKVLILHCTTIICNY